MFRLRCAGVFAGVFLVTAASVPRADGSVNASSGDGVAMVTYVTDTIQERYARVLIRSLREFGGPYDRCPVYLVVEDTGRTPCRDLERLSVTIVPLKLDSVVARYPLAIKAFAAAAVEKIVQADVHTLAWFDPETIIVGPIKELDLAGIDHAALRPVFLVNTIGLREDSPPGDYWAPILEEMRLSALQMPVVTTVIDEQAIRAYFNCEVFSVNPRFGICGEWARALDALMRDTVYQRRICSTFLRRLFLHQAVFSAAIIARTSSEHRKALSLLCGYPLHAHGGMPEGKKLARLDSLSCGILEDLWIRDPGWMVKIPAKESLRFWLEKSGRMFRQGCE